MSGSRFIKTFLLFLLAQTLCVQKAIHCAFQAALLESERDTKENVQKKWLPPMHRVPIIECAYSLNEEVGTTLMFLANAFQKIGPCIGYQTNSQFETYSKALKNYIPENSENTPGGRLYNDVIGVIMGYLGHLSDKEANEEFNGKKTNSWMLFEQHIGTPSCSPHIQHLNPAEFYKICIKQEQYIFSGEWLNNVQHNIIKMTLDDLQKMAYRERAHNPYAFTLNREAMPDHDRCSHCKTPYRLEPEDASWIEINIHGFAVPLDISKNFESPCKTIVNCTSCEKPSTIWYTRKFAQYPQLLMILLMNGEQSNKATIPLWLTVQEVKFNVYSVLGHTINTYPIIAIPYVIFADKRPALGYWENNYHTDSTLDTLYSPRDRPLAVIYEFQEKQSPTQINPIQLQLQEKQPTPAKRKCIIL